MEFFLPIRVYYEDTDAGGVVYHSKYLNYCERARTEALRTLGFEQDDLIANDDTIFAVRSIQVEYIKPARFNDEITVKTRIEQLRKASITFAQVICAADSDELLCSLTARVACLTASRLKPRAIPETILNKVETVRAG
ncbi:MAG: tol-pal system-associated acyl-CoA thioesterase [Gammaproteobacteria bacterium]|nr:tol-pal system-associated acyl-CoA thioesterase [Gammaproteobacteria bacterium]